MLLFRRELVEKHRHFVALWRCLGLDWCSEGLLEDIVGMMVEYIWECSQSFLVVPDETWQAFVKPLYRVPNEGAVCQPIWRPLAVMHALIFFFRCCALLTKLHEAGSFQES